MMDKDKILEVAALNYSIRNFTILKDVHLDVFKGEFVGIIGPNGSGKSTLLKNIYKILKPKSGSVQLKGKNLLEMPNRYMAQRLAVVSQENDANFDFTVREVVQMGRYPRKKLLESPTGSDQEIVIRSMEQVGMNLFADRSFLNLSGGEKQRVLIARALAQETEMIILDEPTNHLDIGSQIKTLDLMKQSGKTILVALHDLSIAAKFCDRIYVMNKGSVLCEGKPEEVISSDLIQNIYGIQAEIFEYHGKIYVDYQ